MQPRHSLCSIISPLTYSLSFLSLPHAVPPTLTFFPSIVRDVVSGETLDATCRADASPAPEIQWFREGQLLNGGNQIPDKIFTSQSTEGTTTSSQLTVIGFTPQEAGVYTCVAVNALGNDSRSFQIRTVGESPYHTVNT